MIVDVTEPCFKTFILKKAMKNFIPISDYVENFIRLAQVSMFDFQ